MLRRITIVTSVLVLFLLSGKAQDPHFSQLHNTPLWVNPALAGQTDGDMRLIANYRNQWSTVTVPYQTAAGSFDTKIPKYFKNCSYFGAGVFVLNDQAGDAAFRTSTAQLSLAYHQSLSAKKPTFLSLGFMVGAGQMAFDQNELYFDNQFDGGGFNTGLASGENFSRTSLMYLDISAGLTVTSSLGEFSGFYLGVGMYHLNQPNVSFLGDDSETLYMRTNLHAGGTIGLGEEGTIRVLPEFIMSFQGPSQEVLVGAMVQYAMSDLSLYLGGMYRNKDAFIPMFRMDIKTVSLTFSYDVNTSELTRASAANGGMEISLKFTPKVFGARSECDEVKCPYY